MAKFEKDNGDRKKRTIITSIVIVLILLALVGGFFLYKGANDKKLNQALVTGYGVGYNKSIEDVAQGQTQSGTILVWQNNSVQIVSIQDICNRLK